MSLTNKLTAADKALAREALSIEKTLIRNYQTALKEIRLQIAVAYEKYGGSYADMVKYQRLTNLEKNIGKEIAQLTGKNAVTLKKGIGQQFAESYYRTAFAMESEVGAKLGFGLLNPKVIERAVENPLDRVGFLARNRENQARLTRQLNERLTQGLIQGRSYPQVARDIKERMDTGAENVLRIARTEMHRVQQQGRLDSLEQAETAGVVMVKVWVASLDDRTRDSHQDLDGQKVKIDEQFTIHGLSADYPGGFGVPEEDINCRCSIRAEIEGYEPKLRRVRGEGVVPYTDYSSWKKGRING